jgi:sporulation protein YlmC with PRC-barrel domain
MAKHIELEDGTRIGRLSDLHDFKVAEGYTDIRGWRVEASDGREVGRVHELLVDLDSMRTRYIDVRLHSLVAAAEGDRDVLIPVGAATIATDADKVVVPLTYDRISLLPAYVHPGLTRSLESELRRHFALGEAAARSETPVAGAGAGSFYDHEVYDDRRFYGGRPGTAADVRSDGELRVPVDPEDTVVLKRGEDGHDEIVVRRPAGQ